ncbi:helix-turn-helix domain-containing protein [Roseateles sp. L2-2]|uniref:helix-turn-helix domain-containing protein n=1 Tax=Roseateles sp. L2-2 TaxID=3422597 RepID=UPI003D36BD2D
MKSRLIPTAPVPRTVTDLAAQLGKRIRVARIRRKLRQQDLADRAGLSRTAIEAVESGKLSTGLGTYLRALWAMGLADNLDLVADPGLDRDGLALELNRQTMRVQVQRKVDNDF